MLKNYHEIILALNRNYFRRLTLVVALIMSVGFTTVSLFGSVNAESGEGNDVFKVVVSLFGITNSTKDVLTLVSVEDQTKIKLFNPEDPENRGQDKVSYTMTFPGIEVQDGDPYAVCTMTTDNFKLKCDKGNNSPLDRPEFVDINVGSGGSTSKEKNEDKDND